MVSDNPINVFNGKSVSQEVGTYTGSRSRRTGRPINLSPYAENKSALKQSARIAHLKKVSFFAN